MLENTANKTDALHRYVHNYLNDCLQECDHEHTNLCGEHAVATCCGLYNTIYDCMQAKTKTDNPEHAF